MFYIKNKLVMFKSTNSVFQFESNVECVSQIIRKDKKHYLNIKLLENQQAIQQFDTFCKQLYHNYENSLKHNCLFTKLPFRYNRFSIQFDNLKTSEQFQVGKIFNCSLQFGGFVEIDQSICTCFKIIKVW